MLSSFLVYPLPLEGLSLHFVGAVESTGVGSLVTKDVGAELVVGEFVVGMVGRVEGTPLGGADGTDGADVMLGEDDGNFVIGVGRGEELGTMEGKSDWGATGVEDGCGDTVG